MPFASLSYFYYKKEDAAICRQRRRMWNCLPRQRLRPTDFLDQLPDTQWAISLCKKWDTPAYFENDKKFSVGALMDSMRLMTNYPWHFPWHKPNAHLKILPSERLWESAPKLQICDRHHCRTNLQTLNILEVNHSINNSIKFQSLFEISYLRCFATIA